MLRKFHIVSSTLYPLPIIEGLVRSGELHRSRGEFRRVVRNVWTVNEISIRVMKPQEHEILRICYDGVAGNSWLMELVKEPLKSLMGIVSHRILVRIVSQLLL